MDEVRVERLIQKYKDNGELDSEDPALLMLKKWPVSRQYKDNPDKLTGLEQLVCKLCMTQLPFLFYMGLFKCINFCAILLDKVHQVVQIGAWVSDDTPHPI